MDHHSNKIHQRTLKLIYNVTPNLSFGELLVKDKSVSIHQKNFQLLATEIFKGKNRIGSKRNFPICGENLNNISMLHRKMTKAVYNGSETLSSLSQKNWELI